MASLTIISWRDIPAQVVVKRGRETAKVQLSARFQEAVDRAASSQSRHFIFKPCSHFLSCHSLGSRLQQLNRQAIGALALTLEICFVIGSPCFEPRDLRLQCLDLGR